MRITTLEPTSVPTVVSPEAATQKPRFSIIGPAGVVGAFAGAAETEIVECRVGGSLAARLNEAAQRAEGEFLVFTPFGGSLAHGSLEGLLTGWEQTYEIGGATCALRAPSGQPVPNGFHVIEDQLDRIPLLQTPTAGSEPLAYVSTTQPDLILLRQQAFWGVGGFDEEAADSLLGFALGLRLRAVGWRFALRRDVVFQLGPCSPTLSGDSATLEDLRALTLKWHGVIAPDALRTPDGTVRNHPRTYGFGKLSDFESFAESRQSAVRSPQSAIRSLQSEIRNPQCAISVVVTTYNSMRTIGPCVQSVLRNLGLFDELILVDNASRDGTQEVLRQIAEVDPRVKVVLNNKNLGFSGGTNAGIRASSGEFVVLLNPDTEVTPGWLARLRAHFADPKVAAVGPTSDTVAGLQKVELHMPHGAAGNFTYDSIAEALNRANARRAVETKLLIGFCMMLRRSALEEMGLLDEELFLGMDDLDLSWRLRLSGYRLLIATDVFVHHEGQVSFKSEPSETVRKLNQDSTDALARKLLAHYGPGNVPTSYDLWDMTWFTPSFDVWTKAA
jgi:GT2 family glycosyltransferase